MLIRAIILIFVFSSTCFAGSNKFWSEDIPIMKGAKNINKEKDDTFFSNIVTYDLKIKDASDVYKFYENYFETNGWENPMKNAPGFGLVKNKLKGWHGYNSSFNEQSKKPEINYGSTWKAKNPPSIGNLMLTMTDYNNGIFDATIKVALGPDAFAMSSVVFSLNEIVMREPKNIFILHKAVGGNPLDIDTINIKDAKQNQNNEIVKEYYRKVSEIINSYKEYGAKHIKP